jgi:ERF superfamily protein
MDEETERTANVAPGTAVEYSAQVGELMVALAKAQAEMDNPDLDRNNTYFTSRYPSLAAVRNATVPVLAKHGISTMQLPDFHEGLVRCITILWCGEQYLRHTVTCPIVKTRTKDGVSGQTVAVENLNHQDYAGVFTYLRRISLQAICLVAGEEDDDGERAVGRDGHADAHARSGTIVRPATPRREETASAATPATDPRQVLLKEIESRCERFISPRKHTGMHKAIYHASFHVQTPGHIQTQPLEVLEAGIGLYRHLTARVGTWDRKVIDPDAWIAEQQREIAREVDAALQEDPPDGVDPETGEDHRLDVALGWATPDERKVYAAEERQAHDEQQALRE